MIAFFALVRPRHKVPSAVSAVMAFSKIVSGFDDSSLSISFSLRASTSNHLIGSSEETLFVPLIASTSLPALSADVAVRFC